MILIESGAILDILNDKNESAYDIAAVRRDLFFLLRKRSKRSLNLKVLKRFKPGNLMSSIPGISFG